MRDVDRLCRNVPVVRRPRRANIGRSAWAFLAWAATGAALCAAALTPFTVGLFVLVPAIVALIVLLRWHGSRNASAAGLIAGAGVVALVVGYLNRDGPGNLCNATETHCVSEWSPWPWLASGVLLVAGAVAMFVWLRRTPHERR